MHALTEKAKKIRLVIFDVDGVLTDGTLIYSPSGIETKEFHVHDGYGIKLLIQAGIKTAIITACQSKTIAKRAADLTIHHVFQNQPEKLPAYEQLKQILQLEDEAIAYIADDLPDLPILKRVGLSISVPNAPKTVRDHVNWVTEHPGGKGAVRELCDFILRAQGHYQSVVETYLKS